MSDKPKKSPLLRFSLLSVLLVTTIIGLGLALARERTLRLEFEERANSLESLFRRAGPRVYDSNRVYAKLVRDSCDPPVDWPRVRRWWIYIPPEQLAFATLKIIESELPSAHQQLELPLEAGDFGGPSDLSYLCLELRAMRVDEGDGWVYWLGTPDGSKRVISRQFEGPPWVVDASDDKTWRTAACREGIRDGESAVLLDVSHGNGPTEIKTKLVISRP